MNCSSSDISTSIFSKCVSTDVSIEGVSVDVSTECVSTNISTESVHTDVSTDVSTNIPTEVTVLRASPRNTFLRHPHSGGFTVALLQPSLPVSLQS